jgi:hypothetical protein
MRPGATPWDGGARAWARAFLLLALPVLAAPVFPSSSPPGRPAVLRSVDGAVSGTVRLSVAQGDPPPMLSPYARPRYRPPVRAEATST